MELADLGPTILTILGWSVGGLFLLYVAGRIYELITPFDVRKELTRDRNTAVGVSKGGFLIACAIMLHGIISSERMNEAWWMEAVITVGVMVICFVLLWVARLVLVKTSRFDFDHHIHVADNLAVGLIEGCSYLAIAIIIHATL